MAVSTHANGALAAGLIAARLLQPGDFVLFILCPEINMKKKVLLLVVDALSSHVFLPALEKGRLPHFRSLVDAGVLDANCSAVFPTITHVALSSLITGTYPSLHGVPGGHWFSRAEQNIVYYIGDFWTVWNEGIKDFILDLLLKLNQDQIKAETLFESVERAGLGACCINYLIHRGDVEHELDAPLLMKLLPGMDEISKVGGPSQLFMGDFVHTLAEPDDHFPPAGAGLLRRYGMDDQYSADALLHLAIHREFPDLTVAYFMDNDYESHKNGPVEALFVLEELDERLGELFSAYGGLNAMLEEICVIVTGDHSQSDINENEEDAVIDLDGVLEGLDIAPLGQPWSDGESMIVCPNMRAAQMYLKQPESQVVAEVTARLLGDPRTDQVLWKAAVEDETAVGYVVKTRDRGQIHFWPTASRSDAAAQQAPDRWGCHWTWNGDLATLDGRVNESGLLEFGAYPNAFERIAGLLDCDNSGQIWATSRPDAEFRLASSMTHPGGGSHGSLHALDSTVPLLVAGLPAEIVLPEATRTVDVAPVCLSILGIKPEVAPGQSHIKHARKAR